MVSNYFKIALRNLLRYKGYSIISISGLGLGLACCMAIFLYVQFELSYDQYHSKKDRIYRLVTKIDGASFDQGIAKVNGPWGVTAANELPEVEKMTRFVFVGQTLFEKGDSRIYENDGFYADSTVFDIFDFQLTEGNPRTALIRPDGIVLTETLAKKYFGDQSAIDKTLTLDNEKVVTVTGVIRDVPLNSHFTFTFLLPLSGYLHPDRDSWIRWNQYYTYLLLRDESDPRVVANKFKDLLHQHVEKETAQNYNPFLQPLPSIHLHSDLFREMSANSDISYLYIFSAIGLLILIISSINFVNLTTARALSRAKEVGIRKSAGALRSQLISQYLSESILISAVALVVGVVLVYIFLPQFNLLIERNLELTIGNWIFNGAALFIALLVGTISGSYPAFYLARLKPSEVLKGKTKTSARQTVRQGLVIIQFAISVFLVVSSVVIFKQLNFIQNKKLGFNPSQLITIPIQNPALNSKLETVKTELLANPSIESVSSSGGQPGGSDWGIPCEPEGVEPDKIPPIRVLAVDHDFVKTFDMTMAQGRDFSRDYVSDSAAYIINEEAARALGWENPLTKTIGMNAIGRPAGAVVGVLKDFHFRSMKEKIAPVMLFIPPSNWFSMFTVRVKSDQMEEGLAAIEKVFAKLDPENPLSYTFFDESYGRLYSTEKRLGKLVSYFTGIGIAIACLGLFSLAAFITEQRTKEIGIRKVMGASVQSISLMLSKDLAALVTIGFVIAAPVGYYIMQQWLGDFAYRVSISPGVFVLSGLGTLLVAWLTVSYKVIKAGLANPVDSLRVE